MIVGIATILLILFSILIHYEVLRILSSLLPEFSWMGLRGRIGAVVLACCAAHAIEISLFASAYYFLADQFSQSGMAGAQQLDFPALVYFSAATYSTIGIGDLYPLGGARLFTGVEAVVGLLLIGWSATFTYLVMDRFWPLHGVWRRDAELGDRRPAASLLGRRPPD